MAILRVEKLKSAGKVAQALRHNLREAEKATMPHVDHAQTKENTVFGVPTTEAGLDRWRELVARLDRKPRSDAVSALQYIVSASPGSLDDEKRNAYLKDALHWIQKRHGKQNVLSATIHRDEASQAHLQVIVVPVHRSPKHGYVLSAKTWTGGSARLAAMQTDFAERVGRRYHLDRGAKGSRAKHKTIKKFYAELSSVIEAARRENPKAWDFIYEKETRPMPLKERVEHLVAVNYRLRQERDTANNELDQWRSSYKALSGELVRWREAGLSNDWKEQVEELRGRLLASAEVKREKLEEFALAKFRREEEAIEMDEAKAKIEKTAYEAGVEAGRQGLPSNRVPPGLDPFSWSSGYVEGKAERTHPKKTIIRDDKSGGYER